MSPQHEHCSDDAHDSFFKRPARVALLMLVLIATFFVLREHWQHVLGYWSYLILLACPLMHLFMHHGHGGHHQHGEPENKP